jgi:two-component sensor histidine kinase
VRPPADGDVDIAWSRTTDGRLSLRWTESGGPIITPPTHRGFGTSIMENIIGDQLRGAKLRCPLHKPHGARPIDLPVHPQAIGLDEPPFS